jgi:hypothetical protein
MKDVELAGSSKDRFPSNLEPTEHLGQQTKVTGLDKDDYSIFNSSYYDLNAWLEREPGISLDGLSKIEHKAFFDEEKEKIMSFTGHNTRHMLMPFLSSDLTVCFNGAVWIKHIGFVVYAFLGMFIFAGKFFPDTEMGTSSRPISACPASNPLLNANMCRFLDEMDSAKTEFRFLIAFVLAGYVGTSVSLWLGRRTNYGALVGSVVEFILNTNTYLPAKHEKDNVTIYPRKLATRYALLIYELSVLKARNHMETAHGRIYLTDLGLLEPGEWELMNPGNRHTTVVYWLQNLIFSVDPGSRLLMDVPTIRSKSADLLAHLNTDQPISYAGLTGALVKLNVIIFSTWKAVLWATWMKSFGVNGVFGQLRLYADILVLFVWNVSYQSLYDLGYFLRNPFGNRRIDVPHEFIARGVHKLARDLSEGEKKVLPPSLNHIK